MTDPLSLDTRAMIHRSPYQQCVIRCLFHQKQWRLTPLAQRVTIEYKRSATVRTDSEQISVRLHHRDLPLLEDAGLLRYEVESKIIHRKPIVVEKRSELETICE